jgi:phage tail protein X
MTEYVTIDGDMVDEIAQARYGATAGIVEAIYAANEGLADLGPVLPAGVTIILPDLTAQQKVATRVKLWE